MTAHLFASTWGEAVYAARTADSVIIGGGTSVQPWLTSTGVEPSVLIHLGDIPGAGTIEPIEASEGPLAESVTRVRIGAMARISDAALVPWFGGVQPSWFATPAVRRRATVVGNVVSRFGPRELVPVLAACRGRLLVMDEDGLRTMDVTTVPPAGLADGEVACAVELYKPRRIAFERVSVRPRASRSEIAVAGAIGQGCGAALSVGISGRSMFIEDAESSLEDPSRAERFAAACRRTYRTGTEVDSDVERLVSGLAERVHRALHASKGEREC
ncbi:FAD binding domain-containing protein [Rhodococcus sp. PD04]|uniref:FAD binding domain-containing protein n=1 Tax=Rhodococcus sp. PD04 TaxID=3109594 RepID=UPI002DD87F00|nr:FAD binding domain-containing protein [Rhodococcus sp. PD04]WSE21893.1 FAD binding domain-containing protein [Rhodococcus sp. PD04]